VGLWALASLWWPFGWDHGIFGWIADVIVAGGVPYRDAWDVKGPLVYYVFAAVRWLTGPSMWGIRAVDLALLAVAGTAMSRVVTRLSNPWAGRVTALLFALQYAGMGYWDTAQPDGWAAMLVLVGVVAPLLESGRPDRARPIQLSALTVGVCTLIKPLYGIFGILPLVAAALLAPQATRATRVRLVAAVVLGGALPPLLCVAWFASQGALAEFIDTYIRFNVQLAGTMEASWLGAARQAWSHLAKSQATLLALPLAVTALVVLRREQPRACLLLGLWLAAALVVVTAQRRFYPYHWHVAYVPLITLSGIALGRLWNDGAVARGPAVARTFAVTQAVLLALLLVRTPLREFREWARWQAGEVSDQEHYEQYRFNSLVFNVADELTLARYLAAHTRPTDRVLVWSSPLANYLADRRSVGRLSFHIPFYGARLTPLQQRYRAEFLRTLSERPPEVIAVNQRSLSGSEPTSQITLANVLPELPVLLADCYDEIAPAGGYRIYARRTAEPAARRR
jgi:hypothetical protein